MLAKTINLSDYGITKSDDGWFDVRNEMKSSDIRVAQKRLESVPFASYRLKTRSKRLFKDSRKADQSPLRGIAVKRPSIIKPGAWPSFVVKNRVDCHGVVMNGNKSSDGHVLCSVINDAHEQFQVHKEGYFAPFGVGAIAESVDTHIANSIISNSTRMTAYQRKIAMKAMDAVRDNDLAAIPDGSIRPVSEMEAIRDANVQGLATGLIQLARDLELDQVEKMYPREFNKRDFLRQLSEIYGINLSGSRTVASMLLKIARDAPVEKSGTFESGHNIVSVLRRVQVGGVDLPDPLATAITLAWKDIKPAKVRQIAANDPVYQVYDSQSGQAFRTAIQTRKLPFYNTLLAPEDRFEAMHQILTQAKKDKATIFPLDFSKHDSYLRADWLVNLIQREVKPKFAPEYHHFLDFVCLTLTYKVIAVPTAKGIVFKLLFGSLGSGHPWTNIIGTLGTRTVAYVLHYTRPDIFYAAVGCNNGDDAGIGIYLEALKRFGLKAILKLAQEILEPYGYIINTEKLLDIVTDSDGSRAMHWEQYVYYLNKDGDLVKLGSSCRYFGKCYVAEDQSTTASVEQGITDQLSVINNAIGRMKDNQVVFSSEFSQLLVNFINNDPYLSRLVKESGKFFYRRLVEKEKAALINLGMSESEAKLEMSRHAHKASFDDQGREGSLEATWKGTFSLYYPIVQLIGLGVAEHSKLAANKGAVYAATLTTSGDLLNVYQVKW